MWKWLTTLAADMAAAELPDPLAALAQEITNLRARVTQLETEVAELRERRNGKINGGGEL